MRKHYRKKKSDTYSMYCVSPRITVSANSQMRIKDLDTDREYLNAYDEISGRWFCNLGCGFRYHRDAYDVLDECTTIINGYLTRKAPNDIVRKSQAVAWTYDYDQGVFGCDYELTEYSGGRKRKAQFSVGSVSMKDLDEIDPIDTAYDLEVSSPGIERELRIDAHIDACIGEQVEVRFFAPYEGKKSLEAVLLGRDGADILLEIEGAECRVARSLIAKLRTIFKF